MRLRHADPSHLAKEPEVAPHHIQLLLLGVVRRHRLERLLQVARHLEHAVDVLAHRHVLVVGELVLVAHQLRHVEAEALAHKAPEQLERAAHARVDAAGVGGGAGARVARGAQKIFRRALVDEKVGRRQLELRAERLVHVQGRAPGSPVQKQNFTTFATSPAWRLISAQQLAVRSPQLALRTSPCPLRKTATPHYVM